MLDYHYKTFLTLIEEGSYTKAAKKLNITQPAVTQHIQHLQEELGIQLLRYEGKQMIVTEKGKYLEEQLLLLNRDILRIRKQLNQQDDAPALTFGATLTIGEYVMPGLIGRYLEKHPGHHLSMIVDNTETLIGLIQKGKIDFALIEGDFNQSQLGFEKLSEEPFIGVCAAANPLWNSEQDLWALFREHLFVREEGSGSRRILEKALLSEGASLSSFERATVVGGIGPIKKLVAQNRGIAFLYRISVQAELEEGTLKEIPIRRFSVSHPFHVVHLKEYRGRGPLQEFLSFYR
ncbi:DNA-binding transcriptional LysR family regulator [Trichococcus patagoniensis]|uniref:DNA-binding transcriptional LysR family regulator n=1 Tax=Trichococcus patagoniensis TaxID=382641 RepID=A0A2T5IK31_9LACT|nr:LysR family transcriptional regulator [Trichococcus patagoniensis]PTQ84167.1 DNA-binding transcriptional LysR family regulator [Trichococcus patagoniensis]